jgi:ribosome biogenesis GTPase A
VEGQDYYEMLMLIGKTGNLLKKKGEVDDSRTATKIINDWQKGLLII